MSYLKNFSQISKADVATVGGKGASLGEMARANFPVPPGFVVTTQAYQELSRNVPDEFAAQVLTEFDSLGAERVAVRSSAIAEDSPGASWAGQFDSYLNVGRGELIESIKKCWGSASSEAVKVYADRQSAEEAGLAIAVVVQRMVNSETSGVVFTINPVTNNVNEIMIEAVYGLGELLVQGMVTPDNYILNKHSLSVTSQNVPTKDRMLTYNQGKTGEAAVPLEKQSLPCLSSNQLEELGGIVKRIEGHYGLPQDIEWAVEDNKFYILQSRPVTTN